MTEQKASKTNKHSENKNNGVADATLFTQQQVVALQKVAEISTAVSRIADPNELLWTAVNQIRHEFELYHAQIYLLNEGVNSLEMVAGAGEKGRQMVEEGRVIPCTQERSLVARAARTEQGVIVNNIVEYEGFLSHPLLPDTQSEMAIPIIGPEKLMGVLDVQSDQRDAFTDADIQVQVTLAAQFGTAYQNAKQAERMRISEVRYRSILETVPDGYYEIDLKGCLTFLNLQAASILGATVEEMLGKSNSDYAAPDVAQLVENVYGQVYETGESVPSLIYDVITIEGQTRAIEVSITLMRDEQDRRIGFRGFLRDVSEREWIQRTLQKSEKNFRSLLSNIGEGYYETNLRGNIVFFNDAFLEIVGYRDSEELRGLSYKEFTNEENAEMLFAAFRKVFETQQSIQSLELTQVRPDGSERVIDLSVSCILDEQREVVGFSGLGRDVTLQRFAELELAAVLTETEEQAWRLTLLNELSSALTRTTSLDQVYEIVGSYVLEILVGDRLSIAFLQADQQSVDIYALHGEKGIIPTNTTLPIDGTAVGYAITHNEILRLPKDKPLKQFIDSGQMLQQGMQSAVCIPIVASGGILGTLNSASKGEYAYTDMDINLFRQIGSLLASTIESRRLDERARLLASIVENHPDFIGVGTLEGQAIYVNPAGLNMMKLPADYDISTMDASAFYLQADAEILANEGLPMAMKEGSWSTEVQLVQTDRNLLPIEQTIGINYNVAGDPISFSITMRDITERKLHESALQEREAELQSLLESSPEAIGVVNTHTGLFESPNPTAERLYGLSYEELIKVGPAEMSPEFQPDGRSSAEAAMGEIGQALQGGKPVFEWVHINSTGQKIPCEVRLVGLSGNLNHLVRFSVTDITARKEAERQLQTSEQNAQEFLEKLKALNKLSVELSQIENSEDLYEQAIKLGHHQLDFERIAFFTRQDADNPYFLTGTFGVNKAGEVQDERSFTLNLKEVPQYFNLIQSTERLLVSEDTDLWDNEQIAGRGWHIASPVWDNEEFLGIFFADNLWHQQPMKPYEPELLTLYGATIANLVVRRQARAQLQLQNTALNSAANGIVISDRQGAILWVNDAFVQLTQYSIEEAIGQNPRVLNSGVHPPEYYENMWQTILQGVVWRGELTNKRKDGTLYIEEMTITPVRASGDEITHFIAVKQDVTERKQAEIILQKQATELGAVAEVATAVSQTLDPDALLQEMVDLTKERFALYHAHIYLLDEQNNRLNLVAGAGKIGQQMVGKGHTIPLLAQSLVAGAARTKEGIRIDDVHSELNFLPNPLLPNTHAEMAIPILLGQTLFGVLDVQSEQVSYFSVEDVQTYSTLASQVAVALQNSRLFAESEQSRQALDNLTRRLTREGWQAQLESRDNLIAVFGDAEFTPDPTTASIEQSLMVQGEPIGNLSLVDPTNLGDEAEDIIMAVAERLSLHLENLRLTEQTQQSLAQTETLYEGSGQIIQTTTLQEALETMIDYTPLKEMERVVLNLFDRPWTPKQPAQTLINHASWERDGKESRFLLGSIFQLAKFPTIESYFSPDKPTIFTNVHTDERADENFRRVFEEVDIQGVIILPLTVAGQWFGVFLGQSEHPLNFHEDEIRQMVALAEQAATVIQNLRLFERTQEALGLTAEQARRLGLLSEMGEALNMTPALTDAYEVVVTKTVEMLGAQRASITMLVNPEILQVVAIYGDEAGLALGAKMPLEGEPMQLAMIENRISTVLLGGGNVDEQLVAIFVPLIVNGRPLGTINIARDSKAPFQSEEHNIFLQIASLLSSRLENITLLTQARARADQERRVRTITDKIRRATDRAGILRVAQEEIGQMLGAKKTAVRLGTQQALMGQLVPSKEQEND